MAVLLRVLFVLVLVIVVDQALAESKATTSTDP
jgi:hypothetical protein